MLAAIKTGNVREFDVREEPIPTLQSGEVLIKVDYCGVCGSDLHAYTHSKGYEFVNMPIILGHEFSGTVIMAFDKYDEMLVGKNVIVESMHYCGDCENCKSGRYSICENNRVIGLHFNGGMAQFVKTKSTFVRPIPPNLPKSIAALAEPMAIAVHAVKKAPEINKDHIVLVQGPGIIGFFVGLLLVKKGAKVILSGLKQDYETRLSKAENFGMTTNIVDQEQLHQKVDYLFECSGSSKAVQGGFRQLKKGGKAIFVALYEQTVNLFLTELVRNEWPIITSYGCDPIDYEAAFEALVENKSELESIISYYPLSEVDLAFQASLKKDLLKSVLHFQGLKRR
jgi:L-iditol 2-dehydrogenase